MDIISHALIGCAVGQFDRDAKMKKVGAVGLFAMLPDFFQLPYYLVLGYKHNRDYYIPYIEDWIGFRGQMPMLDLVWDIPHSLLFVLVVVMPIVKKYQLGRVFIFSYLSHIIADIPTHTGEWNVRYFFPFKFTINGLTDAWTWNISYITISWVVLIMANFLIFRQNQNRLLN